MESPSEPQNSDSVSSSASLSQPGSSSPPQPTSSSKKTFMIGIASMLVLAILVTGGVGIYRTYTEGARDNFTISIARILHLPIAQVNGKFLSYTDYVTDLNALDAMVAYDAQNGNSLGLNTLAPEQKSDQVLIRLASNMILQETADTYGVKVEQSDLDAMKKQIITGSAGPSSTPDGSNTFKTEEDASVELKKRYGWDFKTYEQRVIIPFILQNKLTEKVSNDPGAKDVLRSKAQKVLDEAKNGGNFEELAKKYSDDPSAAEGGDLGWFGKGAMVPQFEEAAFKLKKGGTTESLVETQFGFHIIRLDDSGLRDVKDPVSGKTVKAEQVKARHILFAFTTFDKMFAELANKADIKIYGKVHDPFLKLQNKNASSTPAK